MKRTLSAALASLSTLHSLTVASAALSCRESSVGERGESVRVRLRRQRSATRRRELALVPLCLPRDCPFFAHSCAPRSSPPLPPDFVLHNPRVHLRFFWNERLSTLSGAVYFAPDSEGPPKGAHEGPPKGAHGASVALVFDEILAYPVWRSGLAAFTANLNLNLRRMVPLGSTQRFTARVERKDGRKLYTRGVITSPDGQTTFADCAGLWIESAYMGKTQQVDAKGVEKTVAKSKL